MTLPPRNSALIAWLGGLAAAGVLFFFAVAALLQFLRSDYVWIKTPLSFYLLGPGNGWLHAGFFALAAAIVLIAAGLYLDSPPNARSAATLLLFGIGAAGVVLTALARTDVNAHLTLHGALHLLGAAVAFLFTSTGILVQSWYFRRHPRWRTVFSGALALALIEYLWLWFYALVRSPVNGLVQKITILLILAWLLGAARRLAQRSE